MIRILLSQTGLTPDIDIKDNTLVSVSSGTMTEGSPSIDGRFWYSYSYTGTPGDDYLIQIDAGIQIEEPELRYFEFWVAEESASSTGGGATLAEIEASTVLAKTTDIPSPTTIASAVRTNLATELARLDVAISTRMATFSYTAPDNAGIADIKTKTDNLPVNTATAIGAIPTNPLLATDIRLNNLDAAVSSRLASVGYTAPDNAGITAIKAKTDQLIFTGANLNTVSKVVEDKTGYALTAGERTAIATAVEAAILNEGDGQAILNAIVGAIGNTNVSEVALVAAIRADLERVGGAIKAIPTNPLLTDDPRLDHLDDDISSRAVPGDLSIQLTSSANAPKPISIII